MKVFKIIIIVFNIISFTKSHKLYTLDHFSANIQGTPECPPENFLDGEDVTMELKVPQYPGKSKSVTNICGNTLAVYEELRKETIERGGVFAEFTYKNSSKKVTKKVPDDCVSKHYDIFTYYCSFGVFEPK
uniref:ZP domain-containing protein n=1 Tax=Strongyloides papillosus TaxID=174720 RepID=A0A0N5B7S6_STREA